MLLTWGSLEDCRFAWRALYPVRTWKTAEVAESPHAGAVLQHGVPDLECVPVLRRPHRAAPGAAPPRQQMIDAPAMPAAALCQHIKIS